MFPSSALCRTQEAYHRDHAACASLANVRLINAKAASAWGEEALLAERREARHDQVRAVADLAAARRQRSREEQDRLTSENPDRGFESA
ncbi:hypothetical protein GCM10023232_19900 [Sphingosinicella ginsenosidimutans]